MSSENIKTGLKLSEAIKLLEENDGALMRLEDDTKSDYYRIYGVPMLLNELYDVKLPPPKTVTVTRDDITKAYNKTHPIFNSNSLEYFCKELGL